MSYYHHNTVSAFSKEIFRKHLTEDELDAEILFEDEDYWVSKTINKHKFLLPSDNYKDLPIVYRNPLDDTYKNCFEKVHLNNRTHYIIRSIKRAVIQPKQTMSPMEFFSSFADIPHSNPLHWNLYKGICIAGNFSKTMVRVSARTQFGKSSVPSILRELTKQTRVIVPASFPALLRRLSSTKMVFITEPKKFEHFDTFLEIVGDRGNHFENPKLESKGAGTENEYNVSELSLLLGYNHFDEFSKKEDFFDNIFSYWIQQRFIPFVFSGEVKNFKQEKYDAAVHDKLLNWLRSWYYYKANWINHLHGYSVSLSPMKWGTRYIETFNELVKFFDFVSENEKEFDNYIGELIRCHQAYGRMMNNNSMTLEEVNIPKKVERIKEEVLKVTEESIDDNYSPQFPKESKDNREGFSESVLPKSDIESPLSPLYFLNSKEKHEVDIDLFLDKYPESILDKMLSEGEIFKINKENKIMIKILE